MIMAIWFYQNYRIDTENTMKSIQNELFISFCWDFLDSYDFKLRKMKIVNAENEEFEWEEHMQEAKAANPNFSTNPLFETQQKIQFKLKLGLQKTWDDAEQRRNFQELVNKAESSIVLDIDSLERVAKILNEHHWKAT